MCYSLLGKMVFASSVGRIWICSPTRLEGKTIWVTFYLRNSCGIHGLASCQPSPAYTSIMSFIQQRDSLTKTASH